jgi:hypothetical protein
VERNKPRVLIGPDARVIDTIPRLLGPRYEDLLAPRYRLGRSGAERMGISM